jgi:hypothetical protein
MKLTEIIYNYKPDITIAYIILNKFEGFSINDISMFDGKIMLSIVNKGIESSKDEGARLCALEFTPIKDNDVEISVQADSYGLASLETLAKIVKDIYSFSINSKSS